MLFKKKKRLEHDSEPRQDRKKGPQDFVVPSAVEEQFTHTLLTDAFGGERYARAFHVDVLSGYTWFGMFDGLSDVAERFDGDVDIAIHVEPTQVDHELKALDKKLSDLYADRWSEGNPSRAAALDDEIADVKERQRRLRMNIERTYRTRIEVIASSQNKDRLISMSKTLAKSYAARSLYLRPLDGMQLEALKSIVPITKEVKTPSYHTMTLETSNLADFFLFSSASLSHTTGPIIGHDLNMRPVWLDTWAPGLPNQHMVVIGRSGAGKTYTTMLLVFRSLLSGIQHAILDWKGEYGDFAALVGAPYLELYENSPDRLNPFDLDIAEDLSGTRFVDIESAVNFVQALVFKMLRVYEDAQNPVVTTDVKIAVNHLIRELYSERGITRNPESLYVHQRGREGFGAAMKRKEMPTLLDLYHKLREQPQKDVQRAAQVLKQFTREGGAPSYAIFDGQSTADFGEAPFLIIALNRLDKEIMRSVALAATTHWITERWAKRRPKVKKRILIEEAQNLFNDPDIGAPWVESAYRELRAYNAGVVAVTQGLEVFMRTQSGIAALKNSTIKIIGKQEKTDIESVADVLNLTEGESEFVIQALRGEVLVRIDDEGAFVKIKSCPWEHMAFTTDPNDPAYWERKRLVRQIKEAKARENQETQEVFS
ncbi:VirB4 family type IV secretion system protein [Thermicanus aegyptius]|uniref:VirB4 family type IV secretion system protein n=1 Tax=Thermicanus aegyptius TaxID=94009 RepID=UPI000693C22F|nr:DUF87 domain-containing protein [Thermicanus aegyptius]